jgi:hypothetical protein
VTELVVPYRPRANVIVGLERKHITVFRVMSFLSEIVVIDHEYRECSTESAFNQAIQFRSTISSFASKVSIGNLSPRGGNLRKLLRFFLIAPLNGIWANRVVSENSYISGSK